MKLQTRYIWIALLLAGCSQQPLTPAATPTVTPRPEPTCKSVNSAPTPGPEVPSLFPAVGEADQVDGPDDAQVTFVSYCDFQDANCAKLAASLSSLRKSFPGEVRIVFRPFPIITDYDKAAAAAAAAEAAAQQGQFWPMHDLLFTRQTEWRDMTPEAFLTWVNGQAGLMGMDLEQFKTVEESQATLDKINQAWLFGANLRTPPPILLINGQIYTSNSAAPLDAANLDQVTRLILLGKRQFSSCPPMTIDPAKQYLATLKTGKGDITIELFASEAPMTVNSFVFLARNGWFDNITFHRVVPGFIAQTGDPSGTGAGNPGYLFSDEISTSLSFKQAGMVAMASAGPNANGSQFFITYAPAPNLEGSYTIFGQVLRGMDVLAGLTGRIPEPGALMPPGDRLITVSIEEH
jgi:cyclophilin family peptidyl-prolyl cis-trans isomerase